MSTRSNAFLSVALLVIYAGGYMAARQAAWIVHRAGYFTDEKGEIRVAGHEIVSGDFAVPSLAPVGSTIQRMCVNIYIPARKIEGIYWKFKMPLGSKWPTEWRLRRAPPTMRRNQLSLFNLR